MDNEFIAFVGWFTDLNQYERNLVKDCVEKLDNFMAGKENKEAYHSK